jgi:hypothetical protein
LIRHLTGWQLAKEVKEAQSELDEFFGVDHVPAEQQQQQQQQFPLNSDVLSGTTGSAPTSLASSNRSIAVKSTSASANQSTSAVDPAIAKLTAETAQRPRLTHVGSDGRARMVDVSEVRAELAVIAKHTSYTGHAIQVDVDWYL